MQDFTLRRTYRMPDRIRSQHHQTLPKWGQLLQASTEHTDTLCTG